MGTGGGAWEGRSSGRTVVKQVVLGSQVQSGLCGFGEPGAEDGVWVAGKIGYSHGRDCERHDWNVGRPVGCPDGRVSQVQGH